MADGYLVGQGKIYLATRNTTTNVIGAYRWIGDASGFEITGAEDFLDYEENYSGSRVRVVHIALSTTAGYSMDMRNITAANLAAAVHGNFSTGAGATVTAQQITGYNDSIVFLANPGVSSVVINKAGVPLVLNTDYTLDALNGTITILPGSTAVTAVMGAVALTANYTFAANGGTVQAMTARYQEFALRYVGFSQTDGSAIMVNMPRVTVDIAASLALIGNDVATLSVSGGILPAPEITASPTVSNLYTITRGA